MSKTNLAMEEKYNYVCYFHKRINLFVYDAPKKRNMYRMLLKSFDWNGMSRGGDYDRESGKSEFLGKEYIPDFILDKNESIY